MKFQSRIIHLLAPKSGALGWQPDKHGSNIGRISGKVRIKGSQDVSPFYTTVNNTVPVAVRNLWVPAEGKYKIPTIMEFSITEKPTPDASLRIYTAGWVDSQGREPH
jgi:hypothetical protein